ncbi:vanadium-dependent haloperoxidase [Variovorax sp. J22R133]|uniref:vanadium-dependent haloperoxidase n=1 Tax=Variovorax brevis TaxID=3053503 RepID=UPI002574A084|nr:vanadium-dependent haloperoxidase [Variovorax sp. J22R133]MDM0117222.1 vanadium-dependent haloperoxidase [Variovorax sp. J22R133]
MKRRTMAAYVAGSLSGLALEQATAQTGVFSLDASGDLPSVLPTWNASLGNAIAATKTGPTIAARALSMVYEAAYNAWASYDATALFTLPAMRRRPGTEWNVVNKSIAVSHAVSAVLVDLFPGQKLAFAETLAATSPANLLARLDWRNAVLVGQLAGAALLQARHDDGSNQLGDRAPGAYSDYTGYSAVNTPDSLVDPMRWTPLRVPDGKGGFVVQKCLTPQWGLVRPFALSHGGELRPAMDHVAPSAAELAEIVSLSANLTDEQKLLADYWAGGPGTVTPPGMWAAIAAEVSRQGGYTLDQDVKMFFMVGQALLDASIAVWDVKLAYDSCRPFTAVRTAYKGQIIRAWGGPGRGTQSIRGEDWFPFQPASQPTPAFPEFVSGHSTFSGAAAAVLRAIRGSDSIDLYAHIRARSSLIEPGMPLRAISYKWSSLSETAASAGMSRRYGGIHFRQGDMRGRSLGARIAQRVWAKSNALFNGRRV